MRNIELIQLLQQCDPNMEVEVFLSRGSKLHKVKRVYIGNEKYLPNGDKTQSDKIVIEA